MGSSRRPKAWYPTDASLRSPIPPTILQLVTKPRSSCSSKECEAFASSWWWKTGKTFASSCMSNKFSTPECHTQSCNPHLYMDQNLGPSVYRTNRDKFTCRFQRLVIREPWQLTLCDVFFMWTWTRNIGLRNIWIWPGKLRDWKSPDLSDVWGHAGLSFKSGPTSSLLHHTLILLGAALVA